jgi:hypothetical protein
MKKPTNRKPMRIGALLLREVAYKNEYRIEITWRDPARRKKWENNWRAAEDFARAQNSRLEITKATPGNRHTLQRSGRRLHQEARTINPRERPEL